MRPFGTGYRLLLLAFLVVALLGLTLSSMPSAAAEAGIEVVSVGWDGTVVPGTWSPVQVRVSGATSDLNAQLDVVVKYRQPSPGSQVTIPDQVIGAYGQEVALPAGSTKELT